MSLINTKIKPFKNQAFKNGVKKLSLFVLCLMSIQFLLMK